MKSFVVIGMGRFGSALAMELSRLGHEVLVMDESEEQIAKISDHVTHAVIGDAKDEQVIRSVGVRNFDCVVVAIAGDIEDSVLVTLTLKELGVKTVIAKAQSLMHMKVLERVGADKVVFPERDMGHRLAQNLVATNIIDFLELSEDYSIVEITTPKAWRGKSIKELNIRGVYGINIIAVRERESRSVTVSPPADYRVGEKDILIVIGKNEDIERLREK